MTRNKVGKKPKHNTLEYFELKASISYILLTNNVYIYNY